MVITIMIETELNFLSALFIFVAAAIPIYLSFRLRGNLKKLTIILSIFTVVHGAYHVAGTFGFDFLAEGILEPMSVAVLIFFGLFYLSLTQKKQAIRLMEK